MGTKVSLYAAAIMGAAATAPILAKLATAHVKRSSLIILAMIAISNAWIPRITKPAAK